MSEQISIDINADVGEGVGNEVELMPFISSCNIACGGHAGNTQSMTEVVRLAKKFNVKIGAHPSFPDKENFGRKFMKIDDDRLFFILREQIMRLLAVSKSEDVILNHVKPHGALYNRIVKNKKTANTVLDVIESIPSELKLYAPPNSIVSELAINRNMEVVYEAFADRNYNEDLSLVSRKQDNAILSNKIEVLDHFLFMIRQQKVKAISGVEVPIKASTFCVHGDTKNAVEILEFLNSELPKKGINIQ